MTDVKGSGESARLRKRCPQFADALDDFYLSLSQPQAFEWRDMPDGWKFCQRIFAKEYRCIEQQQVAAGNHLLQTFLKAMAQRG